MKYEIDLHGFTHDEAIFAVEDILIKESMQSDDIDITIITGNSPQLQIRIIQEVLDKYNFKWYTPSYNNGVLVVSEKNIK